MKLVLASGSPRRRELLASVGVDFEVLISNITEAMRPNEAAESYVARLADEKAAEVAARRPHCWVIAADTIVCLEKAILEKPRDRADAITLLSSLAGREHVVYTGLTLRNEKTGYRDTRVATTRVRMSPLSRAEIEWYVDTGEPMDKAGAYAVQGVGALFIEEIHGNYTNVVGLPLSMLFDMMRKAGINPVGG